MIIRKYKTCLLLLSTDEQHYSLSIASSTLESVAFRSIPMILKHSSFTVEDPNLVPNNVRSVISWFTVLVLILALNVHP